MKVGGLMLPENPTQRGANEVSLVSKGPEHRWVLNRTPTKWVEIHQPGNQ